MAVLIPNQFSTYQLTEDEMLQGSLLTITQKQVIQNHLASIAAEKNAQAYDPDNQLKTIQQEAYNRGQQELIMYLLNQSAEAEEALNQENSLTASTQNS